MKSIAFHLSPFALCALVAASAFGQTDTLTINKSTGLINVPSGVTPNFPVLHVGGVSVGAPAWSSITGTPTTLGGYGITDAVSAAALATWAGTSNVTTLGTVTIGTWQGTVIDVAHGGTGTATPGLVAGSNVTITGRWPAQTVNASGGGGGGGGVTHHTVADAGRRMIGTYNNGDLVTEVGAIEVMQIAAVAESGNYGPGTTPTVIHVQTPSGMSYGPTYYFWINVNGGNSDPGYSNEFEVDILPGEDAITIANYIWNAMSTALSGIYTVTNNGDGTLTLTALTAFSPSSSAQIDTAPGGMTAVDNPLGALPTNTTFLVIDSTQSSMEAGYAPQHSASDWQLATLSGGTWSAPAMSALTPPTYGTCRVELMSLGSSSTNAGALSFSVASPPGILTVTSSNPADSSQFLYLIVHY